MAIAVVFLRSDGRQVGLRQSYALKEARLNHSRRVYLDFFCTVNTAVSSSKLTQPIQ